MRAFNIILALILGLVPLSQLEAQHRVPEVFVVDDQGLWQWKPFKPTKCIVCPRAPRKCMHCFGSKKISKDPLLETACVLCAAEKKISCVMCSGSGKLLVEGGSPKGNNCFCCNGKGTFKCSLCRGKGRVETVKFGSKSILKASHKALKAAQDELSLASRTFRMPGANLTDAQKGKDFAKKMKPFAKFLKAARSHGKGLISILKSMSRGQGYIGHHAKVRAEIDRHRKGVVTQTELNLELIKLAIRRHAYNEKRKATEKD